MTQQDMVGKRLKIYYNLHKHCLSLQYKGKIIGYADSISLENVELKVSQSGRERVLRDKRKNVHAYVIGTVVEKAWNNLKAMVTYNPYKYSTFVNRETLEPVYNKKYCTIKDKNIYCE